MDFSSAFHHSTYSSLFLLVVGIAGALAVAALCRWVSRGVAFILALLLTFLLLVLAGEHIPLIASFAPRTFCFGDIGVTHIVAFALPLLVATFTRRASSSRAAS